MMQLRWLYWNRLRWVGSGGLGLTLLVLGACSQPSFRPQEPAVPAPAAEEQTLEVNDSLVENRGIRRVTLAALDIPTSSRTEKGVQLPEVRPLELGGKIAIAGSPTVFPITQRIVEQFTQDGYPKAVETSSVSSSEGFQRFCQDGIADIVNASRPIRDEETAACARLGRAPIAFEIATDAMTFVVSRQNEFLPDSLTPVELRQLFTATLWSDIDPDWLDQPIDKWVPAPNSHEFDILVQGIFENGTVLQQEANTTFFDNEDLLLAEALTNDHLIGVVSHGHYQKSEDVLRPVAIAGIAPNPSQNYPLTRPLFIYADANAIRQRPEIAGFITYYLTHVKEQVKAAGYFPAPSAALEASKTKLLQIQGAASQP